MTKFSNKLKKPCFWPIVGPFPQFWRKKNFPGKFGRKDGWKDGEKDRQTLFYRTLLATAEGQKGKD